MPPCHGQFSASVHQEPGLGPGTLVKGELWIHQGPFLLSTWRFIHTFQAGVLSSLGEGSVLIYGIALAGGLENEHLNVRDL